MTVNGVTFDDNLDGDRGRCQENARKVYEATTGRPMPGKACCAGRTRHNLLESSYACYSGPFDAKRLLPGDFLYFSGGSACDECGTPVGHVGIWLGNGRMFQHTSRSHLAITDQGPTADQRKRFVAAFRLLPQAQPEPAILPAIALPDGRRITKGVSLDGGAMQLRIGKDSVAVRDLANALGFGIAWDPKTKTATLR